jgi:hypothetical protein
MNATEMVERHSPGQRPEENGNAEEQKGQIRANEKRRLSSRLSASNCDCLMSSNSF